MFHFLHVFVVVSLFCEKMSPTKTEEGAVEEESEKESFQLGISHRMRCYGQILLTGMEIVLN